MSRVLVRRIKGQLLGCAYPRNIFQPQAGDCLGGFQQRCGWMGLPPWNPLVSCCRGACPPQLLSWTPSQQPTPSSQATEFSPQKGTTKSFSVCSPLGPALRYTLWFFSSSALRHFPSEPKASWEQCSICVLTVTAWGEEKNPCFLFMTSGPWEDQIFVVSLLTWCWWNFFSHTANRTMCYKMTGCFRTTKVP